MKPTPGPWFTKQMFSGSWDIAAENGDGATLARTREEANARLITASPELFACVATFVGEFGFDVECDEAISGADAVDWISQNMRDFRNALNKARGL